MIDLTDILLGLGAIVVSIIGYFLNRTMSELDRAKNLAQQTKNELDVLKTDHLNKHEHLSEKFDDLKDSIVVLTKEIKELTSKIK